MPRGAVRAVPFPSAVLLREIDEKSLCSPLSQIIIITKRIDIDI